MGGSLAATAAGPFSLRTVLTCEARQEEIMIRVSNVAQAQADEVSHLKQQLMATGRAKWCFTCTAQMT